MLEQCTCPVKYPVLRLSEGKYRVGENKNLIFVRVSVRKTTWPWLLIEEATCAKDWDWGITKHTDRPARMNALLYTPLLARNTYTRIVGTHTHACTHTRPVGTHTHTHSRTHARTHARTHTHIHQRRPGTNNFHAPCISGLYNLSKSINSKILNSNKSQLIRRNIDRKT